MGCGWVGGWVDEGVRCSMLVGGWRGWGVVCWWVEGGLVWVDGYGGMGGWVRGWGVIGWVEEVGCRWVGMWVDGWVRG